MTNEEKSKKIAETILEVAKMRLMHRIKTESPIEAMKKTALELNSLGLSVEKSVVTVKAILISIGKELDIKHPYSNEEIEKMMEIIKN